MPATAKLSVLHGSVFGAVLPFSQQFQSLVELPLLIYGSLNRSNMTEELLLKVLATEVQKAGA